MDNIGYDTLEIKQHINGFFVPDVVIIGNSYFEYSKNLSSNLNELTSLGQVNG